MFVKLGTFLLQITVPALHVKPLCTLNASVGSVHSDYFVVPNTVSSNPKFNNQKHAVFYD